jgi:hypothetical protein
LNRKETHVAARRLIITAIATGALLVPAGVAYGQADTTQQGYLTNGPQSQIQVGAENQTPSNTPKNTPKQTTAPTNLVAENTTSPQPAATPAPATVESKGTLPFTGLDVRIILIAGIVLGVMGFGLRRISRQS